MSLFFKKNKSKPGDGQGTDHPAPDAPTVPCDWCEKPANPLLDGFHLLQIAFGRRQERYHFCCDNCYEAFRALYPSRIHRNCYEQSCAGCSECEKVFSDERKGVRSIVPEGAEIKHNRRGHHH